MKIYISGSITNNDNYYNEFKYAEMEILKNGNVPFNPVKNIGFEYKDYIDMGLCELMHCDAIYMIKGYKHSRGAMLELEYAKTVGMKIIYEH